LRRPPAQLLHANAAGDHGQVGRKAALAPKLVQHLVIVGNDLQQHLGCEILDILRLERGAALMGGEVNDVVNQTEITVDEVVPSPFVVLQTSLQESAVYGGEWHK
jgi:hypothetical protein